MEQPDNRALIEIVRAKIAADGPVSFAWFMEQALYHPEHGYYSSGRAQLGRAGDYFTNVSVGPIFGHLLALQLHEIWERMSEPDDFVIVEQGAHNGDLAGDILDAAARRWPSWFKQLRYRIVEPFPVLRRKQQRSLAMFSSQIDWINSLNALPPFTGVFVANELLDAMPVHLLCHHNAAGNWTEKYVDWQNDSFKFVEHPLTNQLLQEQVDMLPCLATRSEVEINLGALDWIDTLADKLTRGLCLTIDYGYVNDELRDKARGSGSLQCRKKHQIIESPFDTVGHSDITAHVNWTAIARRAVARNFYISGFTDQHHFFTGLISQHPELIERADASSRRQLQTLLHPETMGRSFQVLGLSRGIDSPPELSGFKFARPAHQHIGLV